MSNSFASALSLRDDLAAAIDDVVAILRLKLPDRPLTLACVFVSHAHEGRFDEVARRLRAALGVEHLVGCSTQGVIEGAWEIEQGPGLAVWVASLPGAEVRPFHLRFERADDGIVMDGIPDDWSAGDGADRAESARGILLWADPFSTRPELIFNVVADQLGTVPIFGGMASGGGPGEHRLFLDDRALDEGAVGVLITGDVEIHGVVSQGCRPVGDPMIVTKTEGNLIQSLGGKNPLERLEQLYGELSPYDQRLIETGLHLGLAITEYRDRFRRGDFLIVNVIGADRNTGYIAIGGHARLGQTVQFHLRDAAAADEDLLLMLQQVPEGGDAQGVLLFSCNGRGRRMFPEPHHDASRVQETLGDTPLAGMFAQGEIGPVGTKNHLHGFTASLAIFR